MTPSTVVIAGAGPAGLALATFLARAGSAVRLFERAPCLPHSGYLVDLRGEAVDVADDLGVLARLGEQARRPTPVAVLDDAGAQVDTLPAERFGGDLEVPKPALTTTLLAAAEGAGVRIRYGEEVTSLQPFADADLVIGADGVRSGVRRALLGPHEQFVRRLGLVGVGFSTPMPADLEATAVLQSEPGRAVFAYGDEAGERLTVSLSFAAGPDDIGRQTRAEQESAVRTAFSGHRWRTAEWLAAMHEADDFLCGASEQVVLERWSSGRVVLLGDAAACAAPTSGMGTSQALIGARTLAEALAAETDVSAAAARYEQALRPWVEENQALGRRRAAEFGARTSATAATSRRVPRPAR